MEETKKQAARRRVPPRSHDFLWCTDCRCFVNSEAHAVNMGKHDVRSVTYRRDSLYGRGKRRQA